MARRRRTRNTLARASIAALERALVRRQREVVRLEKRRDTLQGRLAKVEADLAALQGPALPAPAARPRGRRVVRRRRRRRSQVSLAATITRVLQAARKPMRAAEVTQKVLAAGYKSKAKKFKQIVHGALLRHPEAARVGKGLYVAKGKARARRKAGRRARKPETKVEAQATET